MLEARPGFLLLRVTGKGATKAFSHESGGHRFQRVPPNEKKGRVHTSTVTVAVLEEPSEAEISLPAQDIRESFTRGSGKGGQHRNKTDTCVILKHLPTGIQVRVDGGRNQYLNRQAAMGVLRARLKAQASSRKTRDRNDKRRGQIGSGMRGDKVRTIALQRDTVTDHVTGKSMKAKKYLRGDLRQLW